MDSPAAKWIIIVLTLVLCFVLGNWVFGTQRSSMETANKVTEELEKTNQALLESKYTQYDGTEMKGSRVINTIRNFEQENEKICVEVNNGRAVNTYVYTADLSAPATLKAKDAKNRADLSTYINPSSNFLGEVVKDPDTGTIIKLVFTKTS